MKVLQLITSLRLGGAETLLSELAPRLQAQGAKVRVLSVTSTMPLADVLRERGVEVRSLDCNGTIYQSGAMIRALRELRNEIETFVPDVLHSHLYLADLLARAAAPRGARLLTTLHNIDQWWGQNRRVKSIAKTWADSWTATLRGTRAVAVSEPVAAAALKALKLPLRHCRVIQNGIDVERFAFCERQRSADPIIIQVGRFFPQKGHDTALRAFCELRQKWPRCRLWFVGDGPDESALRALSASLGIADQVEFLGPRSNVSELLRQAHVYWMPSRWEGLPLACLEAMATGLPVIASDVGALPSLLGGGVGYVTEPDRPDELAAATDAVLRDYDDALIVGRKAALRVRKNYSVQNTVRGYLDAYSQMLNNTW